MEVVLEVYDVENSDFKMEISKNIALTVYQLNKSGFNVNFKNGGFVNKYWDEQNQGFRLVVNGQYVLRANNDFNLRNQVTKDDDLEPMKKSVVDALRGSPCNMRL